MSSQIDAQGKEPKENPLGLLKVFVLCLSLAVMTIITAWPHAFGSTTATMEHNAAMLSMIGMCCGFVYGIGFIPKSRWLQKVFSAPVALVLMGSGFLITLF